MAAADGGSPESTGKFTRFARPNVIALNHNASHFQRIRIDRLWLGPFLTAWAVPGLP